MLSGRVKGGRKAVFYTLRTEESRTVTPLGYSPVGGLFLTVILLFLTENSGYSRPGTCNRAHVTSVFCSKQHISAQNGNYSQHSGYSTLTTQERKPAINPP